MLQIRLRYVVPILLHQLPSHRDSNGDTWDDPSNIPAVVAIVSALILVLTPLVSGPSYSSIRGTGGDDEGKKTRLLEDQGDKTIGVFKIFRLLCTLGLLALNIYQVIAGNGGDSLWPAVRLTAVYASV